MTNKYLLVEKNHGEVKELKKGTFEEILGYLQENENLMSWVQEEDSSIELPNLENAETLRELEFELEKIDLSWWTLEVEEIEEEEEMLELEQEYEG